MLSVPVLDGSHAVLFAAALGGITPFVYSLVTSVSLIAFLVFYLAVWHRGWFSAMVRGLCSREILTNPRLWRASVGRLNWALYAVAAFLVPEAVIAVIFGLEPVLDMLSLQRGMRRVDTSRYQPVPPRTLLLAAIAFVGMASVVIGSPAEGDGGEVAVAATAVGLAIALAGVALASQTVLSMPVGVRLARHIDRDTLNGEVGGAMAVTLFGNVITLPVLIVAAAIEVGSGASVSVAVLVFPFIAGFISHGVGATAYRSALLRSPYLNLTIMKYITPLAALAWLMLGQRLGAGSLEGVNTTLVLGGAVAVVAANLILARNPKDPPRQPTP